MTLLLQWSVPPPMLDLEWVGPVGVLDAVARQPNAPLSAFVVPAAAPSSGLGFRRYTSADSSESNPIFLPAGVATLVPLAANGGDPTSRYQNGYTGSAVAGGEFVTQYVGETFGLRLTMQGKSTVMNNRVIVRMDIDAPVGVIDHDWDDFPTSAGQSGPLTFKFMGYSLDTFLANGSAFMATADQDAYVWAPQFTHFPWSIPS